MAGAPSPGDSAERGTLRRLWSVIADGLFGASLAELLCAARASATAGGDGGAVRSALDWVAKCGLRWLRRPMCRASDCGWCSPMSRKPEKYLRRSAAAQLAAAGRLSRRRRRYRQRSSSGRKRRRRFCLNRAPEALDEIALLTGRAVCLMTGAVARRRASRRRCASSTAVQFSGHAAALVATYDKFHLVPFGEYVPFESLLERLGITNWSTGRTDLRPATVRTTFDVPGAPPAGPLICYEIIFPGAVVGARRPGWLVNVTDDSWFGPWAGPYQHLRHCAVAGDRGRDSGRARRQYRNFCRDRSAGPGDARASASADSELSIRLFLRWHQKRLSRV